MNDIMNEMNDFIKEFESMKETFKKKAQDRFKLVIKDFFEKNENITALMWTQYTPYFNDGNPCEFYVQSEITFTNAPYGDLENVEVYGEYSGDLDGIWATGSPETISDSSIDVEYCNDIQSMINSDTMNEILLMMFGDHVKVTVTRNGFDVEEYRHD